MKNKSTYMLLWILLLLFILIGGCLFSINQKQKFVEPDFEEKVKNGMPQVENIDESLIEIADGYEFYVAPIPLIADQSLVVNFSSIDGNNVWIKLRILDKNGKIIGESGLLKPGQYIEKLPLKDKINVGDEITYVIMGYEIDSYLSAGTVSLKTKVGDEN